MFGSNNQQTMYIFLAVFLIIILGNQTANTLYTKAQASRDQLGKMLNNMILAINTNGTAVAGQANIPFTGTDVYDPSLYK